jgi:hypothetical protein
MKPEMELEAAIDRELKGLPELAAPDAFASRVMLAIESRATVVWHRQSWEKWPATLRLGSFALLLALFGGLCFGGWRLAQDEAFIGATHQLGQWISGASALGNTVNVLFGAAVLAVKQVNTGIIVGGLAALAVGYAICLGLGTVCVRMAFARR